MKVIVLVCALFVACLGYHPTDPFANSDCDCKRFCNYECSINGTSEPKNMTLFRMTMKGVLDLTNKNTGDAAGDTSFIMSRRVTAFECRKDPDSFFCRDMAQFSGDESNSTDLVLMMGVEVDGQWGPYLDCNPDDAKLPSGSWSCSNSDSHKNPPHYPATCSAANFNAYEGNCIKQEAPITMSGVDLALCCSNAQATAASTYTYTTSN